MTVPTVTRRVRPLQFQPGDVVLPSGLRIVSTEPHHTRDDVARVVVDDPERPVRLWQRRTRFQVERAAPATTDGGTL